MDPGDKDVMKEKPCSVNENFFSHGAGRRVIMAGTLMGLLTISGFLLGYYIQGHHPFGNGIPETFHEYARTMAFMTITACQLFYSFSFRHDHKSIFKVGFFSNKYLFGAVALGFALQVLVLYMPFMRDAFKLQLIGFNDWLMILALGLMPLSGNEVIKFFRRRNGKP